ncbi:DUF3885 domain-containing protein [Hymenobacter cellulosilyticus]|uniref:DUF3885 domain-containing protein n=1 Tax=Hymenobacter cellulosilyticus TaxID=2932248 RepID=A0A8T9QAC7_9BACT|nr:DUF3885 domain-containing protein [Hymenobacter cellulosilyticus]UOQ74484.1 DUF3885 domain-containing protein [Hymenobacter cellulosilyticus]
MPLLPSTAFTQHYFPGLALSSGLFYRWPSSIRFDLQGAEPMYLKPGHPGYSSNKQLTYNELYFREVTHRASTLFHAAFYPDDEVMLLYQKSAYKRGRIKTTDFLLRQLGINKSDVVFKKIANPYQAIWHLGSWVRMHFATTASTIPVRPILAAIANQDFRGRSPVIHGDVFFLNVSRGLIFHMYDDRGLDILATDQATLQPLFDTYNSWILDYDRARIEQTFAPV